ncbi:Holliday junction branch migration protein RuvA [Candidatus Collierbacteria bacterium]|nr:Holliday junction branch migration protein RuvA [Candidatus Collierbacteria bacterium]
MIGFLSGQIIAAKFGEVLLNVNGVGYKVMVPTNLSPKSGNLSLYIHTHVREDALVLFGFSTKADLDLFELLIGVSGVGPKSALAILSAAGELAVRQAIEEGNLSFFSAIPGIGKKSAQKILLDLRPKLGRKDFDLDKLENDSELVQALVSLGFKAGEISPILTKIDSSADLSTKIKQALKYLR